MTKRTFRMAAVAVATLASALANPVQGQWGATLYGTGEYATNDVALALAGIGIAPTRQGLVFPVASVHAYWLRYETGAGALARNVSLFGVQPTIGIQNNYTGGMFNVRGGYQFEDADDGSGVTGTGVATGEGAVAVGQLEHWGTGGLGGSAIAQYNFGAETFWGRGRVTVPLGVATTTAPQFRIGGEVSYLHKAGDENPATVGGVVTTGPSFKATSIGPVLEWRSGRGLNLVFGAGRRIQDGDDATYFKIDFSLFSAR